jgi:hypothetical protein
VERKSVIQSATHSNRLYQSDPAPEYRPRFNDANISRWLKSAGLTVRRPLPVFPQKAGLFKVPLHVSNVPKPDSGTASKSMAIRLRAGPPCCAHADRCSSEIGGCGQFEDRITRSPRGKPKDDNRRRNSQHQTCVNSEQVNRSRVQTDSMKLNQSKAIML